MVHRLRVTLEQAAALRSIFKFEFIGKTGELFEGPEMGPPATVLNVVTRNAELWGKLDAMLAFPMQAHYREKLDTLSIKDQIDIELPLGMLEIVQGILKDGVYKKTLETANATKGNQISMGSMVPLVNVERNIEAIKKLFEFEESPMVYFPMKQPAGKQ